MKTKIIIVLLSLGIPLAFVVGAYVGGRAVFWAIAPGASDEVPPIISGECIPPEMVCTDKLNVDVVKNINEKLYAGKPVNLKEVETLLGVKGACRKTQAYPEVTHYCEWYSSKVSQEFGGRPRIAISTDKSGRVTAMTHDGIGFE